MNMASDSTWISFSPGDHLQGLWGRVLAVQANYYRVQLDPDADQGEAVDQDTAIHELLCTRRTRLKKIGQQVMVGDRVRIEEPDWQGGRGAIADILPRQTQLDRPPVANANQILLVFALAEPTLDPLQLSRFLVKAESTGLSVKLCLSKGDLVSPQEQQNWGDRLQAWGYAPLIISTYAGQNLDALHQLLKDQITVISGPSGVGKSSLINHLIPALELRTGEVSGKLGRGRHTTRHVELFELPTGGLLADTPGFNQPDLDLPPTELPQFFPEIEHRLQQDLCQFTDCSHRDEPNCAVRGEWERYDHYLNFLEETTGWYNTQHRSRDEETKTKVKSGQRGQQHHEPKLAPKKYRRTSRRSQNQSLQDLYQEIEPTEGDRP
jgi:ribosome biogenesis GTPase